MIYFNFYNLILKNAKEIKVAENGQRIKVNHKKSVIEFQLEDCLIQLYNLENSNKL